MHFNINEKDEEVLNSILGKTSPEMPLMYHLIDVGCTSKVLLTNSIYSSLKNEIIKYTTTLNNFAFICSVHDIGKCNDRFQCNIKNEKCLLDKTNIVIGNFRHENASSSYIKKLLKREIIQYKLKKNLADVIIVHHMKYLKDSTSNYYDLLYDEWKNSADEYFEILKQLFDLSEFKFQDKIPFQIQTVMSGILVLSDWIASNPDLFPFMEQGMNYGDYLDFSYAKAEKAIKNLDLNNNEPIGFIDTFDDAFKEFKGKARPLQKRTENLIRDKSPGLLIIEAPMGEGKTEAALFAASHWMSKYDKAGLYFGLPTSATSNLMYERLKEYLYKHDYKNKPNLIHSNAWLYDEKTPENILNAENEEDAETMFNWYKPHRRALLSQFGVGSVDQVMLGVLRTKFWFLRIFALYNKVLIIDEVHAYDAYMTTIIKRLLKICGALNIPVILLSATLPIQKKRELMEAYINEPINKTEISEKYPLISLINEKENNSVFYENTYINRKIKLINHEEILLDYEKIAEISIDKIKNGGCCCILMNTVKEAQEVYERLQDKADHSVKKLLLHARFKAKDRGIIENSLNDLFGKRSTLENGKRPEKAILVATQVVEQSMDLDFDIMISAIAPIDLLLQRMGRVFRHERTRKWKEEPEFHVLLPEENQFGNTKHVYEKYLLLKTIKALNDIKTIKLPDDIRRLTEEVYGEYKGEFEEAYAEMQKNLKKYELQAKTFLVPSYDNADSVKLEDSINPDEANAFFNSQTRYGATSTRIILIEADEFKKYVDNLDLLSNKKAKELMLNSLSVNIRKIQEFKPEEPYEPILEGKKKLGGTYIIQTIDNRWIGEKDDGKKLIIYYDKKIGFKKS
jgi:CRISPR-associated endonuclease/helicase Cas3